jgi:hypothetical protein
MKKLWIFAFIAVAALGIAGAILARGRFRPDPDLGRYLQTLEGRERTGPQVQIGRIGVVASDEWVMLWHGYWSWGQGEAALNLEEIHGELFCQERIVPRGEITNFINSRLGTDKSWVVITPSKGARWGEMVQALDACRQSKAELILLNFDENREWLNRY